MITHEDSSTIPNPPDLSAAQIERLALVVEEMGECLQAVGKILRHGWDSYHPASGVTNRHALERELGDLRAAEFLLAGAEEINFKRCSEYRDQKLRRFETGVGYLHHQEPR